MIIRHEIDVFEHRIEVRCIMSETREKMSNVLGKHGILLAFIVLVVIFFVTSPRLFLSEKNITLVLRQVSIWGVIACAMTLVIISGHWDLSVGSLTSLTTVLVVDLHDKIGPIPAILIVIAVGLISGSISGYLVGYQKLNSMIITLGMLGLLQALTMIYSGGGYVQVTKPEETWFAFIGRGFIWKIPFPVIILALFLAIFSVISMRTTYGRWVNAVGGNPTASKYTGIRDNLVVMIAFILTGLCSAIGGVMLGSRIMAAQNTIGEGYEFSVITGVILGGTSLKGGAGNVFKSFIGILIAGMLLNWFILMGMRYYVQWVAQAVIILAVVWIDTSSKRGKVLG